MPRTHEHIEAPGTLRYWVGILTAPSAFLANLEIGYILATHLCARGLTWVIHLTAISMLLVAIGGTLFAWSCWRKEGAIWSDGEGGFTPRNRFLSATGMLMGIIFVLLIVAQEIAAIIIDPCAR